MVKIKIALATVFVAVTVAVTTSSPCSAACSADTASTLYAQARKAFDEKRFDDSISLLRQANACDPNPVYFANIARAEEEAKRPREALAAWRAYLTVVTDARERSRAQGRITELAKVVDDLDARDARDKKDKEDKEKEDKARAETAEKTRQAKPTTSSPLLAAPSEPAPAKRSISVPPLIVTGVGLAGVGVGVGLGVAASSKHDDAVVEPTASRATSLQSDASGLGHAANIALIAGGIVAVGGLVWLGIDLFRPAPSAASGSANSGTTRMLVTGNGVAVSASF